MLIFSVVIFVFSTVNFVVIQNISASFSVLILTAYMIYRPNGLRVR